MLNMLSPFLRQEEESYSEIEQTILIGLRHLASRCDGARSHDGQGFAKPDVAFGKSLAEQMTRLTPRQLSAGFTKLVKYQIQLLSAGIMLPSLEEVQTYCREREEQYAARQRALQEARQTRVKQASRSRTELEGVIDFLPSLNRLTAAFDYNYEGVDKMQQIKGKVSKLRLKDENISPVFFNKVDRRYPLNVWICPTQALTFLRETFPAFVLGDALQAELARVEAEERAAIEAAEAAERAADARTMTALALLNELEGPQGMRDGKPIFLYQHQKNVIRRMVYKRRFICAHDMGLGKTFSALLAAKAIKKYEKVTNDRTLYVLVIGPVSTRADWLESAGAVGLQIGYHTWGSIPKVPEGIPYIVIFDEAHNMQNFNAKRTKRALALAEDAEAVYLLTGTPMKNGRPSNLYPLLVAVHHPIAYPPDTKKTKYDKEFCNAHPTKYSRWDVTGATNLSALNKHILQGEYACLEYKKKNRKDCPDLPEKQRVLKPVELSSEATALYNTSVEGLWNRYEERVAQRLQEYIARIVEETHCSPNDVDTWAEENRIRQGEALVALGVLRHAGSIAKTESAIEMALEVIEEGDAPIVFTAFKDSAEMIARAIHASCNDLPAEMVAEMSLKELDVKIISADLTGKKRTEAIQEFQRSNAPAIVCLYGAGGVGINLQRSANVILVDRPWTPGDSFQAEDRAYRLGNQHDVVNIYWLQLPRELTHIDVKIDAILQAKQHNIEKTLLNEEEEVEGITFLGDRAEDLLAEATGKKL